MLGWLWHRGTGSLVGRNFPKSYFLCLEIDAFNLPSGIEPSMALLGLSFLSPPRTVLVSRLGRVILDDMFDLAECQDKMVRIGRIVGPVREFFVFCHAGPSIRLPESTSAKIVFKRSEEH